MYHHEGGGVLSKFLDDVSIELVYMPAYSPDFNPAKYVFGKLKCVLQYQLWELTNTDLKDSLYTARNFITLGNMHGFFKITGFLGV